MAEMLEVLESATKAAKLPLGLAADDLRAMYRAMLATRLFDQRGMNLQRQGRIGFCVPSMGQEASQIGTAYAAEKDDWIYPSYRTHSIAILRGVPFRTLVDQLYGNATDVVKGRQMPNHFSLRQWNLVSVSSPIGTQISQAAGTARAFQIRGERKVAWTYFGDGGTSEGEFHAGMNFAGVWKAPCVFVCENNQWAISVPVAKQTASESFAIKAVAYGMPGVKVDGNDVLAVYQAAKEARERAARGEGPTLIETFTFRQGPHSSSDDPKRYQPAGMLEEWKKKDPIARFQLYLKHKKLWSEAFEQECAEGAKAAIGAAVKAAEALPNPGPETMFDDVYMNLTPQLKEQRQELHDLMAKGGVGAQVGHFPL